MATFMTKQWGYVEAYCPQAQLDIWESSSTDTTVTLSWNAYYVAHGYAAETDGVPRKWEVWVDGAARQSGSLNINGITNTRSLGSGSYTVNRTKSKRNVGVGLAFNFSPLSWGGISVEDKNCHADGTLEIGAIPSYSVTYDANGGSNPPGSQTKWYGEQLKLSVNQPSREGYTFEGWATSSTGDVAYNAGDMYTGNKALTLYAVWERIKYQINYDANGGTGAPDMQIKEWGINLTLSATTPTYTGYNFKGWNTKKDGTGTTYAAGATYTANAEATLYAQWQEKTYTVKYDANGGSNPPAQQTKKYFTDLKLSTAKPSKDKYNFVGWSKARNTGEATPSDVDYHPGDLYKTNANITLYALWTLAYIHPTVSVPTVGRCLKDGTLDEKGAYIKVSFTWKVDTTIDSTNVANDVKIEYKATDAALWKVAYTQDPKKASGTEAIVVGTGDILPNKTYEIKVIVSDAGGSREVHAMLAQQFRTMDFGNEGRTVAFGKIATDTEGIEFGAPARFRSIHMYKDATMKESVQMKGFIIEQGKAEIFDENKNKCIWRYRKYDDGTVQLWGDMTFTTFKVDTAYNGWFKATTPRFIYPFEVTDINAYPSIGTAIEGVFTASVSKLETDGCYVVIGSPVSYNGMAHIALYMEGLVV